MNITLFGDDETYKNFGKESALITLSHRGDLDWVAGYIMGVRYNFIHVSEISVNILKLITVLRARLGTSVVLLFEWLEIHNTRCA